MLAFMFPGQGSQKRGMGQGLFDEVREYAAVEKEVDALLGYSLRKLCLEDTGGVLKDTRYTQPCMYVVNALYYYKAVSQGLRPTHVAGHSLGEYNALLAAGVFDFLSGLRLVQRRGELLAQAKNGAMAAVLGLTPERIAQVLASEGISAVDIANYNSPLQTVIAGPADDIKRAATCFESAGATMYVPLPVSAAFHSRYMAPFARALGDFLESIPLRSPQIPVIANVTGAPYPVNAAPGTIREMLVEQITRSVQWAQSMRYLIGQGVKDFREVGPGTVLSGLLKQIQQAKA